MESRTDKATPGAEAKPQVSLGAVRRLLTLARPHLPLLLAAGCLMLLSTAVSLSLPLLARQTVDQVLKTRQVSTLDHLALAMIGLILLGALLGYLQFLLMAFVGNRIVLEMRARLYAHLLRLPVAFFDYTRSGDLASHLSNDVSLLQQTLATDLVNLGGNALTL